MAIAKSQKVSASVIARHIRAEASSQQVDQRGSSKALTPGIKAGDELPRYGQKNVAARSILGRSKRVAPALR